VISCSESGVVKEIINTDPSYSEHSLHFAAVLQDWHRCSINKREHRSIAGNSKEWQGENIPSASLL
jgi:hypothetical protein